VLPAGAGPREAAFILLFSATMPPAQATVLALVSRLLITLGDVAWGVLALIGIRKPPASAPTEAGAADTLPSAPDEPDRARR
jgi:glycosyltransferase 2 family protein